MPRGPKPSYPVVLAKEHLEFAASPGSAMLLMTKFCAPKYCFWPGSIPIGPTLKLPQRRGPAPGLSGNGAKDGERAQSRKISLARELHVFFPSIQRAQITALACTLPKDSGRPLSRWSSSELALTAKVKGIVSSIAPSTVRKWLREEQIKPWQHQSWQKPADPRFLERAAVVLNLYEKAQMLAKQREPIVCADEKTCIQALRNTGGISPAGLGHGVRIGPRYLRQGITNLFAALLVHRGETMVRFLDRKRFVDFQGFLLMVFNSLWTKGIRVLHLILDNGPTHAPKQIEAWIERLHLPFRVQIHWLPDNASWLDQAEIVFSPFQRKFLTPRNFHDLPDLKKRGLLYFQERNKNPKPIQWSYTVSKLKKQFGHSKMPIQEPALCS